MSNDIPDYQLADTVDIDSSAGLRAIADPLRQKLLDLVLERAATVSEMAQAVDRPKSTVAHHVQVLVDAGLLRVIRAVACGRSMSGSTGALGGSSPSACDAGRAIPASRLRINDLSVAAAESVPAHEADTLWLDPSPRPDPADDGSAVLGASRATHSRFLGASARG